MHLHFQFLVVLGERTLVGTQCHFEAGSWSVALPSLPQPSFQEIAIHGSIAAHGETYARFARSLRKSHYVGRHPIPAGASTGPQHAREIGRVSKRSLLHANSTQRAARGPCCGET